MQQELQIFSKNGVYFFVLKKRPHRLQPSENSCVQSLVLALQDHICVVSMCCNTVSRLFIDQLFRCGDLSENISSCSVCSLDHGIIFGLIVKKIA